MNSANLTKLNTKNARWIRWRSTSKQCSNIRRRGAIVFDYGNNLRQRAKDNGVENAFDYQGFVPAYIRPLFCEGKGPFRWVALSGDKEDIYKTDEAMMNLFPENDQFDQMADDGAKGSRISRLARSHLLVRLRRTRQSRSKIKRNGRQRRTKSTNRHRQRSSRLRQRRLAEPRNRSDERRLGCNRRLGLSQRNDKLPSAAQRGFHSTTAAESASAIRSTPDK